MDDFGNIRIKGNNQQKQALKETFKDVKQYCDPNTAKQIENVDYIFKKLPVGRSGQVIRDGSKYIVELPSESFTKTDSDTREGTLCHELSHVEWSKKRNNPYFLPSKENELNAFSKEASSLKNFHEDRDKKPVKDNYPISPENNILNELAKINKEFDKKTRYYNKKFNDSISSKEDIMKDLNTNPIYRCLPEKEPTSEVDYEMAIRKNNACENINTIKDFITSIFKSKKSN